jgi:hypothetical protein
LSPDSVADVGCRNRTASGGREKLRNLKERDRFLL